MKKPTDRGAFEHYCEEHSRYRRVAWRACAIQRCPRVALGFGLHNGEQLRKDDAAISGMGIPTAQRHIPGFHP